VRGGAGARTSTDASVARGGSRMSLLFWKREQRQGELIGDKKGKEDVRLWVKKVDPFEGKHFKAKEEGAQGGPLAYCKKKIQVQVG